MSFEVAFMRRSIIHFSGYVTLAVALAAACSPEPPDDEREPEDPTGKGGSGGTTSNAGKGGMVSSSGGTVGTTGGTVGNTGGTVATGGAAGGVAMGGAAGTLGKGGAAGSAAQGKGGTGSATGGASGSTGVGGTSAPTAGMTGMAGTTGLPPVECGTTFTVGSDGFVRAPAAGGACWHGYASAGGDTLSTVMPKEFGMCGVDCMLKVTGTVAPATEENMYAGVAYLGFNLKQGLGATAKMTVVPTGTGIAVTYGNVGASEIVRVQISAGSAATTRWCAPLVTSGAVIPYAMFNTQCWEGGTGTAYAKQPIDTLQLIVPGGAAEAPLDIQLTAIQEM
jgi:hypothetical protein